MDLNVINDYEILNATLSKDVNPSKGTVEMGGLFKPSTCRAKIKVCKNVGQISVICRHLSKIKLFQVSAASIFFQIVVSTIFTATRLFRAKYND